MLSRTTLIDDNNIRIWRRTIELLQRYGWSRQIDYSRHGPYCLGHATSTVITELGINMQDQTALALSGCGDVYKQQISGWRNTDDVIAVLQENVNQRMNSDH